MLGSGHWPFPFPFICSSRASKGEASPQPNTIVLKHILGLPLVLPNVALWSLKKQAPNAAAKASKSDALREPSTKAPGVCFSSDARPADGWGLRIGIFSRKFFKGTGESQSAFWTGWPSKPCQKNSRQQSVLRRDSLMLAACLQGYQEVIRDNLV